MSETSVGDHFNAGGNKRKIIISKDKVSYSNKISPAITPQLTTT